MTAPADGPAAKATLLSMLLALAQDDSRARISIGDLLAALGDRALAALNGRYTESALVSVAGNVEEARDRVRFADTQIAASRALISAPATDQTALADGIRVAEAALQQARTLLDGIDTVAADIDRATAGLPAAIAVKRCPAGTAAWP